MCWVRTPEGWHRRAGPFSLWVLPLAGAWLPMVGLRAAPPASSPELGMDGADRLLEQVLHDCRLPSPANPL